MVEFKIFDINKYRTYVIALCIIKFKKKVIICFPQNKSDICLRK